MFSIIVAIDENNGIGFNNKLPWHIREDLILFRKNTINKKIIMGKTTFLGLPKMLEDREIYVVSKSYKNSKVHIIKDFEDFLIEHQSDETEYFICGGASIYKQAYPYCEKAYVSFVKNSHEVDSYFDDFIVKDWKTTKEVEYNDFIYRELTRV